MQSIDHEIVVQIEQLASDLMDANIRKAFGEESLGGCKKFHLSDFESSNHKYITMYLDKDIGSVELMLMKYEELKLKHKEN